MRKYTSYKKELTLDSFKDGKTVKKGEKGSNAQRVQEWLCLNTVLYPNLKSVEVDSKYGKVTEAAVMEFQKLKNVTASGIVDESTFFELTRPLRNAFTPKSVPYNSFRELICKVAQLHFENRPRELSKGSIGNLGPWVRSYFEGQDGDDFWWCMRFVECVFDIACDLASEDLAKYIPFNTHGDCDTAAEFALSDSRLIRNSDLQTKINAIRPGDLFFKYSPDNGDKWHHVGIITKINSDGIIETIEGNASSDQVSNIGDTSNGTGVFAKFRNLLDKKQLTNPKTNKKYWDYYEVYRINA